MKLSAIATVTMAPNYGLFYGVEITTLCVAVICFTLRLSNRSIKKVISIVSTIPLFLRFDVNPNYAASTSQPTTQNRLYA